MEAVEKTTPIAIEEAPAPPRTHASEVPYFRARLVALVILLAGFFLIANPKVPSFEGFELIRWEKVEHGVKGLPETLRSVPTDDAFLAFSNGDSGELGVATSAPFAVKGALLEFELAAAKLPGDAKPPRLILESPDGKALFDFRLEFDPNVQPGHWTAFRVPVPKDLVGQQARFELRTKLSSPNFFFAVRDRVDFFSRPPGLGSDVSSAKYIWLSGALSLLAAALLVSMLPGLTKPNYSTAAVFGMFFITALLIHLRMTTFFHWDEWHVLERFSKLGFPGVVYTHNEHFLPLFFAFYFLEAKLFGNHYTAFALVSIALHSLNSALLYRFLQRLVPRMPHAREAALLIAFLFLISCLQLETLQWAFEQSVLLCELSCLLAFLSLNTYLHTGSTRSCLVCIGATLAAPLLFGNGFILPVQLFAVAACVLLSAPKSAALRVRRLVPLGLGCFICAASAGYLYAIHRDSAGHGVEQAEQAKPLEHLTELFNYVFTGSEFGAVLRGSGLFPFVQLSSAEGISAVGIHSTHPEIILAWLGFALSLVVLYAVTRAPEHRKRNLSLWLLGQVLVVSCLLLPSVGRWQLGAAQSLALRYHYATLIGVAVLMLPAITSLLMWCHESSGAARVRICGCLLVLVIFGQLFSNRLFDYFTAGGFKHRMYVAQLADWEKQLRALPSGGYEAAGTPFQGGQPVSLTTLTPGRHPNEIYGVLHWLNEQKYPE